MNVRAVVLAAGKGTRMKSARPKVLHEICGKPMLWYALRALRDAGVSDILVVSNAELDRDLAQFDVRSVVQEPQLGTGHAMQIAMREFAPSAGRVIVANGDMPLVGAGIFAQLLRADGGAAAVMVTARMPLPSNFGRVIREGDGVRRIVEERDCDPAQRAVDEMNAGIYAYDEPALRDALAALDNDNAQKEYYLTDTIGLLAEKGKRVVPLPVGDHRDVLGINDRIELARARAEMNGRLCRQYMAAGVTIVDPQTTYVEPGLRIGRDTVLYPGTTVARLSEIGEGCVIGPHTRISNARIGSRCSVRESVITDCTLGDDVSIGPFAHLRGEAVLEQGVKIGNFVEVKNSRLAPGVKASHLTYLGDATIGEETNIGAGTITCNYDGVRKNETRIGKNVFIGSNSSLIAPVEIGDGAVTGASSVVTRDVPAGGRVAGNPARPLEPKK